MAKSREEWAFQALLASVEEANRYLRDVSRRIEVQIRFYITGVTALVGAIAYPFAAGSTSMFTKAVVCVGSFGLYGLGVITFLRLVQMKVQAMSHTAWQKGAEYCVLRMAFGESGGVKSPKTPEPTSGPFSKEVVFMLRVFYLLNGVILSICVTAVVSALLEATKHSGFRPSGLRFLVYGIPGALGFVSSLLLLRQRLEKGQRQGLVAYEQVLEGVMTPFEGSAGDDTKVQTSPVPPSIALPAGE